MKRGRPNIRSLVQPNIIKILSNSSTPLTASMLVKTVSKELNANVSWNTIQKYINELVKTDIVEAMALPHSKDENRPGLTVYMLKKKYG